MARELFPSRLDVLHNHIMMKTTRRIDDDEDLLLLAAWPDWDALPGGRSRDRRADPVDRAQLWLGDVSFQHHLLQPWTLIGKTSPLHIILNNFDWGDISFLHHLLQSWTLIGKTSPFYIIFIFNFDWEDIYSLHHLLQLAHQLIPIIAGCVLDPNAMVQH